MKGAKSTNKESSVEKKSPALQREPDQSGPELDNSSEGLKSILSLTSPRTPPEAFSSLLTRPELSHRANTSQRIGIINHLQRTYGNRYVQRVLQAKLKIGQPGDIYEQEADRVAEQVMKMAVPPVQRQPQEEEEKKEEEQVQAKPIAEQITPLVQLQPEEEEEKEEELQTKEAAGQSGEVSSGLESRINAMKGGGQPLPASTRAFFEPRFGHDFSNVRIHTDAPAAETARALNARAFTMGREVVFGAGRYAPVTTKGKQLMAHELTHVVQQGTIPSWGRIASMQASAQSQMDSGSSEGNAHTYYGESPWAVRQKARSNTMEALSWGASPALQSIGQSQRLSWGADQMIAGAKDGKMIDWVIGVPIQKPLNVVQNMVFFEPLRLGGTTHPKKYKAPNFKFRTIDMASVGILQVLMKKPSWYALPSLTTNAYEGDVKSYYIGPGLHKTTKKEGGLPVFTNASPAISGLIHDAEMEHCNDYKYAYKISLKEAEDVLKNHVVGKRFGPKPTEAAVKQMVLDTIRNNLTHPQLGNDKTKWGAKYKMLFAKSRIRDQKDWHTFDMYTNRVLVFQMIKGKAKATKVTYDIATTKKTKINVVKSKTIITY
jgi:hypothetical protein